MIHVQFCSHSLAGDVYVKASWLKELLLSVRRWKRLIKWCFRMIHDRFYNHSTFLLVSKCESIEGFEALVMPDHRTGTCGCLFHEGMSLCSEQELKSCKSQLCFEDQQLIKGHRHNRLLTDKSQTLDASAAFQRKKLCSAISLEHLLKVIPTFSNIILIDATFKHFEPQEPRNSSDREGSDGEEDSSLIPGLGDDVAQICLARLPRSSYHVYQTVSKKFCALIRSGQLLQTRRRLGIIEQWMYVLSSSRVWRVYSPKDGLWRQLPPTPADYVFQVSDKESLTAGTQLLVRGLQFEGNVIWKYDLATEQWSKGSDMRTPRCLYGSASCGDYGFVAGGVDYSGNLLKSAERYNSLTGRWEPLPDMNKKRKLCSGFYMDEKFYVIGGSNDDGCLTCGEEYNQVTRTWREIPNMLPRSNHQSSSAPPLVAVADNRLYAFEASQNLLSVYDKVTNRWSVLGEMPVRADLNRGWGVAFKALEGQLVVIGGQRGRQNSYDDAVWAWRPTAENGPPDWHLMTRLIPSESFIFNCAVMTV